MHHSISYKYKGHKQVLKIEEKSRDGSKKAIKQE